MFVQSAHTFLQLRATFILFVFRAATFLFSDTLCYCDASAGFKAEEEEARFRFTAGKTRLFGGGVCARPCADELLGPFL